ncbi:hypothetical protein [Novosphingobium sp. 9U]|uniref:DUF6923 family protein n=1 Tax=Novosphingobium sp. 9U TaxID=2653158 RepID=UPI0012EF02A0|nr:hypothetical protein [Novosphingobium sp. 9U]VWX49289.1 conserved hypothetical protein [Novosphingobium sp. 9U]
MASATVWFGVAGDEDVWYLRRASTAGFSPVNVALLPGFKPSFSAPANQVTTKDTDTAWFNELLFSKRVLMNTSSGITNVDVTGAWNTVKNLQIKSAGGQNFYVDGIVHVDAQLGYGTTEATNLFLNGVKRANVITGDGGDTIDIRMCYDQNSVWNDDFRIATFGGDDVVRIAGLAVAQELAAGDLTYIESVNKPGLPLLTSGAGHNAFFALGAGNDTFIGYNTNDHVEGGTDGGAIELVYSESAPSGFAYSIGGATAGGHNSTLYKIDLSTGVTIAVGPVSISGAPGNSGTNLDVESLTFSPVDGQLYGFVKSTGNTVGLIKVDPLTAATTFIGGTSAGYKAELQDMAFGTDGKLYIVSEGDLLSVNTSSGDVAMIGDNTLSKKIAALAINPDDNKLYGLAQEGSNSIVYSIDKATGLVGSSVQISNLPANAKIEGMGFDSSGKLWAEDRVSGQIYSLDLTTKLATAVSTTLGTSKQTGDGFEQLAIDGRSVLQLTDVHAKGGDLITTGEGHDHIFYAAGDGVDRVTDFDVANDILHISGYTAAQIDISEWNGNTVIRFHDNSPDGFVDSSLIQLDHVMGFNGASISYVSAPEYYL